MSDYWIKLTPSTCLQFECKKSSNETISLIQDVFLKNWREGWLLLAARKLPDLNDPTVRYWQQIASYFITALCHLPEEVENVDIRYPEQELLDEWVAKAPLMIGGEYLSSEYILKLWDQLIQWVQQSLQNYDDIHHFLSEWAPLWHQVGRVCFHLAENKKDTDRPFAFLATYSTGFGAGGKLKHLPLGEALKQYAGSNDRHALIKLLTPIQNASQKCAWVQKLVSNSEIYQPLAWPISKAYQFLNAIPELEESGLSVRIPNWWKRRQRPQVSISIGSKQKPQMGASSLLDFNLDIVLGSQQLSMEELDLLLNSNEPLVFFKGEWVEVDREKLQNALAHWKQVQKLCKNGEISFIDGMRLLAGNPLNFEKENKQLADARQWVKISAGEALAEILHLIKDPSKAPNIVVNGLKANLRPYQQEGIKWLSLLYKLGLGACLADDMGLGKTLQILTLLLQIKMESLNDSKSPALLVVPTSLLANWKQEAARFTPSLSLFLLHTSEIKSGEVFNEQSFKNIDLVITTYSMIAKFEWLANIKWDLIILDEAQAIKNTGTKQTRAIKTLQSKSKIALTGTPIENRLSDLWSLFDFLNPALLGSAKKFKEYTDSLQKHSSQFEPLRKLVNPYILRRMKTDPKVISDLPEKIETPAYCNLSKQQIVHYQTVINTLAKSLETVESKNRRGLVLKTLLELKQICNHPSHYSGDVNYLPEQSGKFDRLKQICEELASRQEKVLIFTQFSEIIPALEEYLSTIFGRKGLILHGETPVKKRQELVNQFQEDPNIPFFILSIKAGGTGLTLTAANHVIHFDRWWNPAVENQATDRAFRIGQKKNVQVHKFITLGTIEEKIDMIITSKSKLANDLLSSSDEISITQLSDRELVDLLNLDINKAMAE